MDNELSVHRASCGMNRELNRCSWVESPGLPISPRRAGNLHCDYGVASNRASSGNFGGWPCSARATKNGWLFRQQRSARFLSCTPARNQKTIVLAKRPFACSSTQLPNEHRLAMLCNQQSLCVLHCHVEGFGPIPALGGARWAHVKHVAHRAVVDGFEGWIVLRRSEFVSSVQDLGNEGLVLDECETGGRIRPA
jgi:hypothetical protein